MMVYHIFIFGILFITGECQEERDFCDVNDKALICAPGRFDDLKGQCPGSVSRVNADIVNYRDVVNFFNDARKELAQGLATTTQGGAAVTFPTVGDAIQLEWNSNLTIVARMLARLCPNNTIVPPEDRAAPGLPHVDMMTQSSHSTSNINTGEFVTSTLNDWKTVELTRLYPFVASKGKDNAIVYGKAMFVGCGGVSFRNEENSQNEAYVVCMFSRGDIESSSITFGKPACSACPAKTNCSSDSGYAGILCAYNEGSRLRQTDAPTIAFFTILTKFISYTTRSVHHSKLL